MASPPPPPSPPHTPSNTSDYWHMVIGIAGIAAVLLASNAIAFACCSRGHLVQTLRRFFRWRGAIADGINDRSLRLIPAWKYSKEQQGSDAECSVCLSVFVDGEDVRQMPGCKHLFHAACIDMWLYSHSDCPLCRAKVLPLPPCCPTAGGREESGRHPMETATMAGVAVVLL